MGVGVWDFTLHWGVWDGFVFGLGCFLVVFCVGVKGLSHTGYVKSMEQCGSVGVGYVECGCLKCMIVIQFNVFL